MEEYKNTKYKEELLERCDYTKTYKNYGRMLNEYIAFLEENGIKYKFKMKSGGV